MSDQYYPDKGDRPPDDSKEDNQQQVRVNRTSARVPQTIGHGVFSTGAIVMSGGTEFLIDFVQRMGRPHHVVARVIIPFGVMPQLIQALETNVAKHAEQFGEPMELPKGDPNQKVSIEDVYDHLKLPDEMLSGVYANAVMVSHSAAEFSFDFITSFFPNSSVSARVFLSAPHVKPLLDSLSSNWRQLQQRNKQNQPKPNEGDKGEADKSDSDEDKS